MLRRHLIAMTASSLLPGLSQAQAKPLRLVVPFPPGGATDITARALTEPLSRLLGQPVVVDNRAGAGGSIGMAEVAKAAPDGLTLGVATLSTHGVNPAVYKKLPYDPLKDFVPVTEIVKAPGVLVAHPSVPARSFEEFVKYLKANPGKVTYASPGNGTIGHMWAELFKSTTNTFMVHIPYRGAGPALNDLLGGQIPMMFDSVPGVLQHIQSGKLRALGVTSLKRSPALPDVPTIDEAGLKGFEATAWFGLYAPGGMQPQLRARIAGDVLQVLRSPAIQAQFAALGAEPGSMTQPQFAAFVDAELNKWGKVIRDANVTIN